MSDNRFSDALSILRDGDVQKVAFPPTQVLGVTSVPTYGGYVDYGEKSADLTGTKRYTTFADVLANVGIVAAGVRYFLNLVAKAKWSVTPADDSKAAQEAADFVQEVMDDMDTPWSRVIRRASMYRFYGYSIQEWTAKKRNDGKIGLLDIEPRAQSTIERWDVNDHGDIAGVWQTSPHTSREIYLPREKLVYVVDDTLSDSPEGLGLFRHIVPHAKRVMRYENLEGIGFETDLRGVPIGRAPKALLQKYVDQGKMTKSQMTEAITSMETFVQNHIRSTDTGLVLDSLTYQTQDDKGTPSQVKQWDMELLSSDANSIEYLGNAIDRVTHNIAMIIGVEQLLLGRNARGSHALSQDKTHNFYLVVDSTLTELTEAFERDFLGTLWQLNGMNDDLKPSLTPETIRFQNLAEITAALEDLARAGAPLDPRDPVINEIRELFGLSRVPEELLEEDDEDESLMNEPPVVEETAEEEEEPDGAGSRDE